MTIKSEFIIMIAVVIFVLALHTFLIYSKKIKENRIKRLGEERSKVRKVIFDKYFGVLLFGVVPGITALLFFSNKINFYGIDSENLSQSLWWILGLSPVLILMTYLNAGKEQNLAAYPQIRLSEWSKPTVFISALSWVLYLTAYEFLFRGYFLFISDAYLGFWPAIILNIIIYSIAHIPKGIKETLGAIPFGLFICIITLKTGNILTPLMLHVVMALSQEWFSLRAHPDMKIIKR